MKYKVGDKVLIKSLDWYNEAKKSLRGGVILKPYHFSQEMKGFCGRVLTIKSVRHDHYEMEDCYSYRWTDEMIEGLVEEEEIKPKFKKGDCVKCSDGSLAIIVTFEWSESLNCYQYFVDYIGTLDAGYQPEDDLQLHSVTTMNGKDILEGVKWKHEFECPDGYEFRDENGNVINATKIVLEKKKPKYPKTYGGCCDTLYRNSRHDECYEACLQGYPMQTFARLLICRDAYWKIAGEMMGLGKSWKPIMEAGYCTHAIIHHTSHIRKSRPCADSALLEFPTEEMRDAFYENFKDLIEECKELL